MSQLPPCIQYIQALGPTVVAVVAAGIAGYIAWRQWSTAHDKLSFDLYEKRFKIYEAAVGFLATAAQWPKVTEQDCKALFTGIRGAEFLFDKQIKGDLENIRNQAWAAFQNQSQFTDEQVNVFSKQAEALRDKFRPYLDLSKAGLKRRWPW
jgi:hypothetical protein